MIRYLFVPCGLLMGFPRACGDDPDIRAILAQQTAFPRVCGDDPYQQHLTFTTQLFPRVCGDGPDQLLELLPPSPHLGDDPVHHPGISSDSPRIAGMIRSLSSRPRTKVFPRIFRG